MAIVGPEGLCQLKISNDLIGARNRDLSACSVVLQSTTLPRVPRLDWKILLKLTLKKQVVKS
jgi:hypothetical protein